MTKPLQRILDRRETQQQADAAAEDAWLRDRAGLDPEQRREAWRHWLRQTLEKTLQWPKNEAARERLVGQCAAEITTLCRQLAGRGWLLDGKDLAKHVSDLLKPIAEAQKNGKVSDFWPYFRASVARYVDANADTIQLQARRSGADEAAQTMAGVMAVLSDKILRPRAISLTEIVAARDIEIRRDRKAKEAADAAQMELL